MLKHLSKLLERVGDWLLLPMHFSKKHKLLLGLVITIIISEAILLTYLFTQNHSLPVLHPQGLIGVRQRNLIYFGLFLSLFVVIPVFAMTFWIVWRYRDTNPKPASYRPEWDGSRLAETIWWGIPISLILILSVVTWRTSHSLDPSRPLASTKPAMVIQVVALQWKWLFIYPEQNVATVNYVRIPVDQPVEFQITADAPMNSFWIPALGGQIYAMTGMATKLNLVADHIGTYNGVSANISGKDFADMTFQVEATDNTSFDNWVKNTQQQPNQLTDATYQTLAQPNTSGRLTFGTSAPGIFSNVVGKYNLHTADHEASHGDNL